MATHLSEADVAGFLSAFASAAEPVEVHFLWRPQLADPADELVLEAAVNGQDDVTKRAATLSITDTIFVEAGKTADYQMTRGLLDILDRDANQDDLMAFMIERNLTADELELGNLAAEILKNRPEQGYLTISPALQWRLQYKRVIDKAGDVAGIHSVYKGSN